MPPTYRPLFPTNPKAKPTAPPEYTTSDKVAPKSTTSKDDRAPPDAHNTANFSFAPRKMPANPGRYAIPEGLLSQRAKSAGGDRSSDSPKQTAPIPKPGQNHVSRYENPRTRDGRENSDLAHADARGYVSKSLPTRYALPPRSVPQHPAQTSVAALSTLQAVRHAAAQQVHQVEQSLCPAMCPSSPKSTEIHLQQHQEAFDASDMHSDGRTLAQPQSADVSRPVSPYDGSLLQPPTDNTYEANENDPPSPHVGNQSENPLGYSDWYDAMDRSLTAASGGHARSQPINRYSLAHHPSVADHRAAADMLAPQPVTAPLTSRPGTTLGRVIDEIQEKEKQIVMVETEKKSLRTKVKDLQVELSQCKQAQAKMNAQLREVEQAKTVGDQNQRLMFSKARTAAYSLSQQHETIKLATDTRIAQLEESNKGLVETAQSLKTELERLQSGIGPDSTYANSVSVAKEAIACCKLVEHEKEELSRSLADLKLKVLEMDNRVKEKEEEMKRLEASHGAVIAEKDARWKDINNILEQNAVVRASSLEEVKRLHQVHLEEHERLLHKGHELAIATDRAQKAEACLQDLQQQLNDLRAVFTEVGVGVDQLSGNIDGVRKAILDRLAESTSLLSKQKAEFDARIELAAKKIDQLQTMLAAADAMVETLQKENEVQKRAKGLEAALQNKNRELEASLLTVKAELAMTAVNVREHAESDERIKSLEAALASAQQQTAQSDLISRLKADELTSAEKGKYKALRRMEEAAYSKGRREGVAEMREECEKSIDADYQKRLVDKSRLASRFEIKFNAAQRENDVLKNEVKELKELTRKMSKSQSKTMPAVPANQANEFDGIEDIETFATQSNQSQNQPQPQPQLPPPPSPSKKPVQTEVDELEEAEEEAPAVSTNGKAVTGVKRQASVKKLAGAKQKRKPSNSALSNRDTKKARFSDLPSSDNAPAADSAAAVMDHALAEDQGPQSSNTRTNTDEVQSTRPPAPSQMPKANRRTIKM